VKTINLLCAVNKIFVKYQNSRRGFNPKTPPLHTPLCTALSAGIVLRIVGSTLSSSGWGRCSSK